MLVDFLIGFWFNNLAKVNNANQTTWVILGIVSYLAGQFILALAVGLIDINLLENRGTSFVLGVIGGLIGVFVAKYLLEKKTNNKTSEDDEDDIIDTFIE
jgi:uncharacterized membrane protein YeaQ/YmgE (transglycosylase-associated protein family)